jgi:hypothetical protein
VANHLVGKIWDGDKVNAFRRDELTSAVRESRGKALLSRLDPAKRPVEAVLGILRDKGVSSKGERLHLGNRRAIDALIATHAVIFDGGNDTLYVSRGPGVSGGFVGFDLGASFAARDAVLKGELPRDPLVSDAAFAAVRGSAKDLGRAEAFLRKKKCDDAKFWLDAASEKFREQNLYYLALGDYHDFKCDPA